MSSSVINSSRPFNHSSSGSSLPNSYTFKPCYYSLLGFSVLVIERSINFIVGYPANIMVMWLVAREKSDSSTSNNFIFFLALADAWLCVMSPICCFGVFLLRASFFGNLILLTTGIKNISPVFLACICLDRYVAVVHPIVFASIKDNKIRVTISVLVWGLIIAFALCRSLWTILSDAVNTWLILAAFAFMVFCNVSIIWSLRKSVLGKHKMHPMKKKALRTVQIYLGIIVFHYLPTVLLRPAMFIPNFKQLCDIDAIMASIMYYSTTTAPLLYITQIKQLPWLKEFLCLCCRSPSPEPHNVST